jgi:hypothetical protein
MSRKSILAIAVAALGMSTLVATEASARFGGGGLGGGGARAASVGHAGGISRGGNFSRATFHPTHLTTGRVTGRTFRTGRVTSIRRAVLRPPIYVLHHPHHHHWWWTWCRFHHHYRCGGYPWIDVGGVDAAPAVLDAPQAVAATPVAATCTNDCDYFLNNEPGCYMAKRAFSTPQGEELRCVKICDPPEADDTAK